jgi:hypothetical protein
MAQQEPLTTGGCFADTEGWIILAETARVRRQVIIVTHNANLVVNTDADQVVVATAGPHRSGDLPEISYESGGRWPHERGRFFPAELLWQL